MLDMINKSAFNWNFSEDDWFISLIMQKPELIYKMFIIKNYNSNKINDIVYEIYNMVKEYRSSLELETDSFIKKKQFLILSNKSNDKNKIQISLDEEYKLKELIEQYKAYELIGWFHLGKNSKIFKICTLKKQSILEKIYPIVDLSIRKVIGSKVINPKSHEFEEAVNNAWLAIIKYLPKIDTSKVMFSVFVGVAHRSAIYYNVINLREKYNTVKINDLYNINNDEDGVGEDLFINTVLSNNVNGESYNEDVEDDILNEIEMMDIESEFYLENVSEINDEIEETIKSIEDENNKSYLHQNILAYTYNILSGKLKKMCFEKIFAEFFNDLINSKISEKILNKHSPTLIEIMNLTVIDPEMINDEESNNKVYKLFRDWIKEKINVKLYKYNVNITDDMDEFKKEQLLEIVKRENNMIKYIKENKNSFIEKLLNFKDNCINLNNRR